VAVEEVTLVLTEGQAVEVETLITLEGLEKLVKGILVVLPMRADKVVAVEAVRVKLV
jgi:hypothetical protein